MAPVAGKHVVARLAVSSEFHLAKDRAYEVLIKLVRLETNEVLSVSQLEIDARWGEGMMTASRTR